MDISRDDLLNIEKHNKQEKKLKIKFTLFCSLIILTFHFMICRFSNPVRSDSKKLHMKTENGTEKSTIDTDNTNTDTDTDTNDTTSTVILVSIDGFRNDYLERLEFTPTLNYLSLKGNKAQFLKPAFPSKTFPNHYSIATGLLPESHGIVDNAFYDKDLNQTFNIRDTDLIKIPEWWGGSPIWIEAEKNNIKSAVCMWVGCNVEINGYLPSYLVEFNATTTLDEKFNMVSKWLKLPKRERPKLILIYLPEVDEAAHNYGVHSDEVNLNLMLVDKFIAKLYKKINKKKYRKNTNLIVVSDHGMADIKQNGKIYIDDIFDEKDNINVLSFVPHLNIKDKDNLNIEYLYNKMLNASIEHGHWIPFKREEILERYHYRNNKRISPIIGIAEEGYSFAYRNKTIPLATHGYDNEDKSMRAFFLGVGPVFSKFPGQVIPSFNNVEIFNLITHILNIGETAPPNNGTVEAMEMFKYYLNI